MIACPSCGAPFTPSLPDQTLCDNCSGLVAPEESSPLAETRVGAYKLVHQLGAGRFSTSWLAEPEGGGGVVLKLLRAYAPDEETVQRFLVEASRLAGDGSHEHRGIARVLEAGVQIGGALFLVYESGGELTMADELRGRGRMLPGRALELCAQLCDGLQALHDGGHRHMGIKPANVGLAKDDHGVESAVLLDAFTAHLLTYAGLRETGMIPISTAAYLSPEEAEGRPADGRADLYAVGVLLYQLISGRLPLMGSTAEELLEAHRTQRALRLRDVGRKVHPDVEAVVARLLAKQPAERFAGGEEAAAALRAAAPHAEEAPAESAEEEVEDPVPISAAAQPPEPEVVPPKPAAPIEPGLEEAMLGRVTAGTPKAAPARAAAKGGLLPGWLTPVRAAVAALVVVIGIGAAVFVGADDEAPRKRKERKRPAPAAQAAAPAPVPPPPPAAPAPPAPPPPAPDPAPVAAPTKAPAAAPAPAAAVEAPPEARPARKRTASASRPAARSPTAEAAQLLAQRQPKPAIKLLLPVLDGPGSSDADRLRATRLMAEAEVQLGNKPAAVDWYRKYLRLTQDSSERARVVKLIQALNR